MSVTVMVSRSVELTSTQVKLLEFFGGILDGPPPRSTCATLEALERHGLVEPESPGSRFVINDSGRQVLAELAQRNVLDSSRSR